VLLAGSRFSHFLSFLDLSNGCCKRLFDKNLCLVFCRHTTDLINMFTSRYQVTCINRDFLFKTLCLERLFDCCRYCDSERNKLFGVQLARDRNFVWYTYCLIHLLSDAPTLWYTYSLIHLHFDTPTFWYTYSLIHLFSDTPTVWYTYSLIHPLSDTPIVMHLLSDIPTLWYTFYLKNTLSDTHTVWYTHCNFYNLYKKFCFFLYKWGDSLSRVRFQVHVFQSCVDKVALGRMSSQCVNFPVSTLVH
jgi:hypothetical protein